MKTALSRSLCGVLLAPFIASWALTSPSSAQGTIYPFGSDHHNQVSTAPSTPDFLQVSTGLKHSVGLRAGGFIKTWGGGGSEVLDGPTGNGFIQVAAGGEHTVALRQVGSIVAWGEGFHGQMNGIPVGTGYTDIAAGLFHSLAIHSDGSLHAWGLSDGSAVDHGQVTGAPTGNDFIAVAAGGLHSLALRTDGSIVSWGGISELVANSPTGTGFIDITGGSQHSAALRADGSIVVWGSTTVGLGLYNHPTETGFTQIVLGQAGALALRGDGTIATWPYHAQGVIHGAPQGSNFTSIATSNYVYYGLRDPNPGNAYCFGDGTGAACPCGTPSMPGQGCPHTGGTSGATLTSSGNAFQFDGDIQFHVTGMTSNKVGLLLRGLNQVNGGLGMPAGNGLLCTGGQIARSQLVLSDALGDMTFHHFKGEAFSRANYGPGITATYQLWYRDPVGGCTGTGFNFSNAWSLPWVL